MQYNALIIKVFFSKKKFKIPCYLNTKQALNNRLKNNRLVVLLLATSGGVKSHYWGPIIRLLFGHFLVFSNLDNQAI